MVKNLPAVWFDPWIWKIPWIRKWQPTPIFLPGKSHKQRSLVGYSPWDCKTVGHVLVSKTTATFKENFGALITASKKLKERLQFNCLSFQFLKLEKKQIEYNNIILLAPPHYFTPQISLKMSR